MPKWPWTRISEWKEVKMTMCHLVLVVDVPQRNRQTVSNGQRETAHPTALAIVQVVLGVHPQCPDCLVVWDSILFCVLLTGINPYLDQADLALLHRWALECQLVAALQVALLCLRGWSKWNWLMELVHTKQHSKDGCGVVVGLDVQGALVRSTTDHSAPICSNILISVTKICFQTDWPQESVQFIYKCAMALEAVSQWFV